MSQPTKDSLHGFDGDKKRPARRGFHTRMRPSYSVSDTDIESKTGRHAVNELGLSVGEVVYLRATVVDARIAPGEQDRVIVTLTDQAGKILNEDVQVDPDHIIRSSAVQGDD